MLDSSLSNLDVNMTGVSAVNISILATFDGSGGLSGTLAGANAKVTYCGTPAFNTISVSGANARVEESDNCGGTASGTFTPPPENPMCLIQPIGCGATVTAGATPAGGPGPLTVRLEAALATDLGINTDSIAYTWHSGDGQTAAGRIASLTFTTPGEHLITVTAIDPGGYTATAQTSVRVDHSALQDCVSRYFHTGKLKVACISIPTIFNQVEIYRVEMGNTNPFIPAFEIDPAKVENVRTAESTGSCLGEYSQITGYLRIPCVELPDGRMFELEMQQRQESFIFDITSATE